VAVFAAATRRGTFEAVARYTALRASDADREAVAERLRHAAVEGRLEPDELEQRLHTAFRARTYGELNRLLDDLPAQPVRWERPRSVAPAARTAFVLATRLAVALVVLAAFLAVAAFTFAWWLIGLVVWLAVSSSRRSCHRHAWHRPPHVRRVSPRRL
jgi:hypothetical protein